MKSDSQKVEQEFNFKKYFNSYYYKRIYYFFFQIKSVAIQDELR